MTDAGRATAKLNLERKSTMLVTAAPLLIAEEYDRHHVSTQLGATTAIPFLPVFEESQASFWWLSRTLASQRCTNKNVVLRAFTLFGKTQFMLYYASRCYRRTEKACLHPYAYTAAATLVLDS